jgi:hypothetical protein
MKRISIVLNILLLAVGAVFGQEETIVENADSTVAIYSENTGRPALTDFQRQGTVKVVEHWIREMFKAENVSKLMAISEVPFALDRETVVTTTDELRNAYLKIFEDKGKRAVPDFRIQTVEYISEILQAVFPLNFVIVSVQVADNQDKYTNDIIEIVVLIRDKTFKIVGVSD